MATTNLKLNIKRPGIVGVGDEIVFQTVTADADLLRIPRRYPFADITNYTALKTAGYFRHATTTVSTELGGSAVTETEGNLGFQLPPTEKLILLVRRTGVASTGIGAQTITIKGSLQYKFPDTTITLPADETFTSGTKIYEIDLFNFGLYITGVASEDGIIITVGKKELEFALIARMG